MWEKQKENRTDSELVSAAQSGNLWAYTDLVRRHQNCVRAELLTLLRNVHDAEDVAQEAFLSAFQKIKSLGPPYNFGAWVRQIARNKALNLLARGQRFLALDQENIPDQIQNTQVLSDEEMVKRVENIVHSLSGLSAPLRETSRLFYLCDYSLKQVAGRLHIPLGTVKRRLWESRLQMKKEVAKMSNKGRTAEPLSIVPKINIEELSNQEMEVKSKGPGLFFGTRLDVGHTEECKFFDYPHGILTLTVRTFVVRKVRIVGRNCYEVLIEHSDCEPPESNVLDYFEDTGQGYRWLMEVMADGLYPKTRFLNDDEELFQLCYARGEHNEYIGRTVNLTVGEKFWGKCLAVWWGWNDGTPAESFYTADGRQVLHRRFVGPNAPASRNYDYDKLGNENKTLFRGKEYKLWYDSILVGS